MPISLINELSFKNAYRQSGFFRVAAHTVLQDTEFLMKLDPEDIKRVANIYAMELAVRELKLLQQLKGMTAANQVY